ncbi:hypothetical protein J7K06_07160 [Candidatus Bathyarchaeota archaeon]|nr:hypothetical protein [Candidatus Bathyarchaeota archaeon]
MKTRITMKVLLVLLFLTLASYLVSNVYGSLTSRCSCWIEVEPENPTEADEVKITVNFSFLTHPPYVEKFGSLSSKDNVFAVNVTIHEPRKDEFVLEVTHTDSFTYQLGKLKAGKYIFQVYVQTVHGSQDYWLENEIEFTVSSCSLDAAPEFSAYQPLLLILALTSLILIIKKFR